MWWWTKPRCRVSITSRYKLPFLIHFLSASSSSSCLPSLSLRKAVEEAMDPGLACITAYVSQDCTGMKDEPAVDKTGDWAQRPGGPCVFRHLFAAVRSELRKAVTVVSLCLLPNKHIHSKTITTYSGLFLTSITWELILKSKTDSYWWCIYLNANFDCFLLFILWEFVYPLLFHMDRKWNPGTLPWAFLTLPF